MDRLEPNLTEFHVDALNWLFLLFTAQMLNMSNEDQLLKMTFDQLIELMSFDCSVVKGKEN